MRPVGYISVVVFTIMALLQLTRLIQQSDVTLDGFSVRLWWSVPGFLVYASLAVLLFRETRR